MQAGVRTGCLRAGQKPVGFRLGHVVAEESVEPKGIAVGNPHRRQGVGTELPAAFEGQVASLGFERIGLGSAGGYVDEFYRRDGYDPWRVLVRPDPEDVPDGHREMGYAIADAVREEPRSMNPYRTTRFVDLTALQCVTEPLLTPDSDFEPAPLLAKDWEWGDENQSLTSTVSSANRTSTSTTDPSSVTGRSEYSARRNPERVIGSEPLFWSEFPLRVIRIPTRNHCSIGPGAFR